jgi:hypothetical protein
VVSGAHIRASLRQHGLHVGWIVTYVIHVRHGGPSSGYISSGFFGGKPVHDVTAIKFQTAPEA